MKKNNNNKQNAQVQKELSTILTQILDNSKFVGKQLSKKEYSDFYKISSNLLDMFYNEYRDKQKGIFTQEMQEKNYDNFRNVVQSFGKVNGSYIKIFEKVVDSNNNNNELVYTTFYDSLLHHSYKYREFTTNCDLASLECEYKKARTKQNEALNKKKDIELYEKQKEKANKLAKKIKEFKQTIEFARDEEEIKQTDSFFSRFLQKKLRDIIKNRIAKSIEEIKQEKERLKKEREERRKPNKQKATTTTKKQPTKKVEEKQQNATKKVA